MSFARLIWNFASCRTKNSDCWSSRWLKRRWRLLSRRREMSERLPFVLERWLYRVNRRRFELYLLSTGMRLSRKSAERWNNLCFEWVNGKVAAEYLVRDLSRSSSPGNAAALLCSVVLVRVLLDTIKYLAESLNVPGQFFFCNSLLAVSNVPCTTDYYFCWSNGIYGRVLSRPWADTQSYKQQSTIRRHCSIVWKEKSDQAVDNGWFCFDQ